MEPMEQLEKWRLDPEERCYWVQSPSLYDGQWMVTLEQQYHDRVVAFSRDLGDCVAAAFAAVRDW